MRAYSLKHLSDAILLRDLVTLIARDRATTATLLAHIAEVDARRLYLPAGHASMHSYCVEELRLSEDAAYKRIQAARAAHRFPVLFTALADGRLHLAAVCLLAPHLTPENADALLAAATHRRKSEIEQYLAQRFAPAEAPASAMVRAVLAGGPPSSPQLAPGQVGGGAAGSGGEPAPGQVEPAMPSNGAAYSAERFVLHLTVGKSTHDKLRYAQALLSHSIPSGDMVHVLDRALDALIDQIEKRKFAATAKPRPRPQHGRAVRNRHVPAHVKRAVWERDLGRCTFIGESGHRCGARKFLEFDHVDPVARGGRATVERMRLRCRGHNQHEAERAFGVAFMSEKRSAGQRSAAGVRARRAASSPAPRASADAHTSDVLAGLRALGFRADEARRAATESVEAFESATLAERMRAALQFLGRRPSYPAVTMSAIP